MPTLIGRAHRRLASIAVFLLLPALAFAQTPTPQLTVTTVETGWSDDVFRVVTDQRPYTNPRGCATADGYTDGYIVRTSLGGYTTHYAATLLAMATGKSLYLIVNDTTCNLGRPVIMGVIVK